MSALEYLSPLTHTKLYLNSDSNFHSWRRHTTTSFRHSATTTRFAPNSAQSRVPRHANFSSDSLFFRFDLWGAFKRGYSDGTRIRASSGQESDSTAGSGEEKSGDGDKGSPATAGSGSNRRKEKQQGKGGWWWSWWLGSKGGGAGGKWRWQPIVQAQEIGVLLLQLGIVVFVMRLLRPGIPLPGSEPRAATTFVSVPYSEFLSKINSDQVQKVEVDGVHIMFKLKPEVSSGSDGGEVVASGGGSKVLQQESESLVKSVAPTKRIVYTTTRPSDIRTPYEKMLENQVEFGSPDKRSGGFFNSALVSELHLRRVNFLYYMLCEVDCLLVMFVPRLNLVRTIKG